MRVHPYVFFRLFSSLGLFLQTIFLVSPENSSLYIFLFLPLSSAFSREFIIAHFPSLPFLGLCCLQIVFISKVFFRPFSSASPHPIHPHPSGPSLHILYTFSSFPSASIHIFLSPDRLSWFFPIPFLSSALFFKSSFLVLQEVAYI